MEQYQNNCAYQKLLAISKLIIKVRGKEINHNWCDNRAKDFFNCRIGSFYRSLSFSVNVVNTYTALHTRFKLSCCSYSDTGVVFSDNSVLDVCFDKAWFLNGIDHHSNKIVLNNVKHDVMQLVVDENKNCIQITEEQFNEEWLFQLLTKYDIPHYDELLVLKEIRQHMMQYEFPMSFCLTYKSDEDLHFMLDKVYDFLENEI